MYLETKAGDGVDPSVRGFFEKSPDSRMDVVVVLNTPQPDLSAMIRQPGDILAGRPILPDQVDLTAQREAFKDVLDRLGIDDPVWLSNAGAVLVKADWSQIEHILKLDAVSEILPNATLR